MHGPEIQCGEATLVLAALRDARLIPSFDRLLKQIRDDPRATALDVLIEAHPHNDDGGATAADLSGVGGKRQKAATHVAVLVERGRVVSCARITMYTRARGDTFGVLSMVGTLASQRRRGLAHRLLVAFLDKHRETEIRLSVKSSNAEAVRLYERLGFKRHRASAGEFINFRKKAN